MGHVNTKFKDKHNKWVMYTNFRHIKEKLENNCLNIDIKQIGLPNFKIQEITIRWPHASMDWVEITSSFISDSLKYL